MGKFKYNYITCQNGLTMSIQAGEGLSSAPAKNDSKAFYSCEIAVFGVFKDGNLYGISNIEKFQDEQFDKEPYFCKGIKAFIYNYVPAPVILEVIMDNGGVLEGELPPLKFEAEKNTSLKYWGEKWIIYLYY